ncbi:hypothetical protein CERZMDRAFT_102810 [Cercospora zeae-maydis SCOH1-5]|uniref:Uncharacterized protein n=1 Tax=Cercospora zeae-maydis SCOH1-5 TaxID=717836 RepID=A0A6A6F134_9PEZI|nr:hypothetical protein CERZMDRAFT_102810 [Cercospora zeae-maydis SCOH1-5]
MAASPASNNAIGKRKRSRGLEPSDLDDDGSESPLSGCAADERDSNSDADSEPETFEGDDTNYEDLFVSEGQEFDGADMPRVNEVDTDVKYHEGKESYPKLPAYDPASSDIEVGLTGIVEQIVDIAEELRAMPWPRPTRIALLGDTGTGKSSLLNSIVDVPDIAKAVCITIEVQADTYKSTLSSQISSGESCTPTAMEYCGSIDRQQESFAAEITDYDEETAKTLLREHISHYRRNTEVRADWDDNTRQLYKRRADTAVKTL